MGLFGGDSSASSPSNVSDARAVAYDSGINATGKKSRVNSSIIDGYAQQFAGAGQASITGDGNQYSFSMLDGGAINAALEFASKSVDQSYKQISDFASQAGQFLQTGSDVAAAETQPGLTFTKALIWPLVIVGALWILRGSR